MYIRKTSKTNSLKGCLLCLLKLSKSHSWLRSVTIKDSYQVCESVLCLFLSSFSISLCLVDAIAIHIYGGNVIQVESIQLQVLLFRLQAVHSWTNHLVSWNLRLFFICKITHLLCLPLRGSKRLEWRSMRGFQKNSWKMELKCFVAKDIEVLKYKVSSKTLWKMHTMKKKTCIVDV